MMWIGYARSGKEFDVEAGLIDVGYSVILPRKVEAIRSGNKRWPEPVQKPVLPNYVFFHGPPENWLRLSRVKHLSPTTQMVPTSSEASIRAFAARAAIEFAERMAAIEAGQRIDQYQPGDLLTILGPFGETLARFRALVERPGDPYPEIVADIDMMGRVVPVRADPLHVRKARV